LQHENTVVLNDIACRIALEALKAKLRVKPGSRHTEELTRLVETAQALGRPRAIYQLAFVESKDDHSVNLGGIVFTSRVLRVNLELAQRVFAFVATCGAELDEWANAQEDPLHRFWAEAISEMALRSAVEFLQRHLDERYRPGPLSAMNPGSLADWPLKEQRPLFALLGQAAAIGVQLTDSLLMTPVKSVSGLLFPTQESFASCQLCPRDICPNRRAPYDPNLFARKYST